MKKSYKTELDKIKDLMYGEDTQKLSEDKKISPSLASGNNYSRILEFKEFPNNKTIAIIKEGNNKYVLKEALTKEGLSFEDFSILGGIKNLSNVTFNSVGMARNSVSLRLNTIKEEMGIEDNLESNIAMLNEAASCMKENTEEEEDNEDDLEIEDIEESFEYKGKEYDVNPFAVCNKSVGQGDKEKFGRCVKGVKKSSKVDESTELEKGIRAILESKLYNDFIDKASDKFINEAIKTENEAVMLNVPQANQPLPQQEVPVQTSPEGGNNDNPFGKEKFDAGVEADEDTDPKKYIEQLTGKLAQVMRKYNQENENPDFDTEKYVINMILSASHTSQMDEEDKKDIISKIKTSKEEPKVDDGNAESPEKDGDKEIQKEELVPLEVEDKKWNDDKITDFLSQLGANVISKSNGITEDGAKFNYTISKNGEKLMIQFPTEEDAEVFNGLINKYLDDKFFSEQNNQYRDFLIVKFI